MSLRITRVNELLKREIGTVIQRDYEWHGALVTVSSVEATQDLKEARVWISIMAGNPVTILEKLNQQHGAIQTKVAKRVVLKSTPVLDFRHDASAERGVDMVNLLEEVDQLPKAPEAPEEEEPGI
ncbi:30S ribosome-binding factor RbfA [Haloferula sp. A504]|uniref:30S ribosome-binding factor RbfA n=1 Tax=Haloferula sp. A504 TaxID=3373601 RepID=UPI0031C55093|nr:30S ribosome-binding factor RbfA [Verrucomicrobiaceae bacterium E54]